MVVNRLNRGVSAAAVSAGSSARKALKGARNLLRTAGGRLEKGGIWPVVSRVSQGSKYVRYRPSHVVIAVKNSGMV